MSDKYCCVTWQELGPELADAKLRDIEKLISDSKLPRSVFASVFKVLERVLQYCPVCGSNIEASTPSVIASVEAPIATPIVQKAKEPVTKRSKCPRCAGRKSFGKDDQGVNIKCMHCHGLGFVDQRHVVNEPKSEAEEAAEARIAALEEGE